MYVYLYINTYVYIYMCIFVCVCMVMYISVCVYGCEFSWVSVNAYIY